MIGPSFFEVLPVLLVLVPLLLIVAVLVHRSGWDGFQ